MIKICILIENNNNNINNNNRIIIKEDKLTNVLKEKYVEIKFKNGDTNQLNTTWNNIKSYLNEKIVTKNCSKKISYKLDYLSRLNTTDIVNSIANMIQMVYNLSPEELFDKNNKKIQTYTCDLSSSDTKFASYFTNLKKIEDNKKIIISKINQVNQIIYDVKTIYLNNVIDISEITNDDYVQIITDENDYNNLKGRLMDIIKSRGFIKDKGDTIYGYKNQIKSLLEDINIYVTELNEFILELKETMNKTIMDLLNSMDDLYDYIDIYNNDYTSLEYVINRKSCGLNNLKTKENLDKIVNLFYVSNTEYNIDNIEELNNGTFDVSIRK